MGTAREEEEERDVLGLPKRLSGKESVLGFFFIQKEEKSSETETIYFQIMKMDIFFTQHKWIFFDLWGL